MIGHPKELTDEVRIQTINIRTGKNTERLYNYNPHDLITSALVVTPS